MSSSVAQTTDRTQGIPRKGGKPKSKVNILAKPKRRAASLPILPLTHRIVRARDGGPIRLILGRGTTHQTGTFVSVKADYRPMPWESRKCELGILQMTEISAGVISLMAQPHRLELSVIGRKRRLIYFPDLELLVDRLFFEDLVDGMRFADIVARPRVKASSSTDVYRVVVEVKHEDDNRVADERYKQKLRLAEEFYRSQGILFITVTRKKDFDADDIPRFESLTLDRHTTLNASDYLNLEAAFAAVRGPCSYGRLVDSLGGGPLGAARVACLQVNRKISIDLSRPISNRTKVYLVT